MQNVSQAWKDAHNQTFVPPSYVEVNLNVGDPDAQVDAKPTDNGSEFISKTSLLSNGTQRTPTRFATLERNLWLLDGTFKTISKAGTENNEGYIGDVLSDANGNYTDKIPTITISFSKTFTDPIPGITITWAEAYGNAAAQFRVTVYAAGATVLSKTYDNPNANMVSVVDDPIEQYDKIVVEVLRWSLPRRRARIASILIGIQKTYKNTDLMDFAHEMFVDPLSFNLPKNQITFKVKNLNGEYNPDNPQGAEKYLMERQSITFRYGLKLGSVVEWIDGGECFMSEWETPQNGIDSTFKARDALEYMSDKYAGPSTGTFLDVLNAASQQAQVPVSRAGTSRWIIGVDLTAFTVPDGVELTNYAIQEVIQLIANATCCVFYQDRSGYLHIEPLAAGETDYEINRFNSYANSEIVLSKQLKAVNINDGQYVLNVGPVGETQPVDNPLISSERAPAVAKWVADYLINRKNFSGSFRVDPRVDALDRIINKNKYAENVVLISEIKFNFNGAFRGEYEGRAGV